ncbi:MAG: hypothetical protein HDT07_03800 [Bacteroidales bacterium]|nr:hypothetical protein [Bacteroidales bacterium]
MFTKSTLKLAIPAALLFAGASAYAQSNVTLLDGSQTTWAEVVNYFNNKPDAAQLKADVDTAQAVLNRTPQTITVTDPAYLQTVKDAKTFLDAFNKWANLGGTTDPSTPKIWFTSVYNKITKKNVLNVAFSAVEGLTESTISNFYDKALDTDAPNNALKFAVVNVYLSDTDMVNVSTYDATEEDAQINVLQTVYDFLNSDETKANYTTEETNPAYTEAQQALADAKTAQNAANNGAYDHITLTGDVTVPAGSTLMNFTGEIDGDNHVFNVASGYLFNTLTGTIKNAAVNGNFARATEGTVGEGESTTTQKATIENVAVWTGKAGTYYDEEGTSTAYTSVAAVAFADRANYGVTDGKLAAVTDANKVYSITVNNSATSNPKYFVTYANDAYTNLANNQALTVGPNVFVLSETDDLEAANVYTGSEGNYTAKEVVITDKTNFYCPVDITAESVEYSRKFSAKSHASMCLPFALKVADVDAYAKLSTFKKQEGNTFNFTYQTSGEVAANTPFLLTVDKDASLSTLSNVAIKATTEAFVKDADTDAYGVFVETAYQDIVAESGKSTVYGLSNNKFLWGANGAKFPAFRMVIAGDAYVAEASAPSRIVIRDEFGDEVDMSGVDNVAADAAELEVAGGVGELTITTSTDLGTVAVYSIDGRVAANVDAVAGTTTVDLAKGVYIVMGKKVLVK